MCKLLIAYGISAVAAMTCRVLWPEQWFLYAILKPLTTALLIVWACQRAGITLPWRANSPLASPIPASVRSKALIFGLCLSWIGDVALLWPREGFLSGLIAFLLAHLAFLVAFTRGVRWGAWPLANAAYAMLAGGILAFLWPGIPGSLRVPVCLYVCCLAAMAAQTASWWRAAPKGDRLALSAAVGGILFVMSDSFLATNKFHSPLPASSLWIQSTYWLALALIAWSLKPQTLYRSQLEF